MTIQKLMLLLSGNYMPSAEADLIEFDLSPGRAPCVSFLQSLDKVVVNKLTEFSNFDLLE